MTFEGKEKFDHHKTHPHESPKVMTVPLIVLAVLSAIGGFIGIPEIFSGEHGNLFQTRLAPVFKTAEMKLMHFGGHSHFEELLLMINSVIAAAGAIFYARYVYLKKPDGAGAAEPGGASQAGRCGGCARHCDHAPAHAAALSRAIQADMPALW